MAAKKKGHVTAVDLADAAMLVDVIEAVSTGPLEPDASKVARNTIARYLADKREEWLSVAMVRAERVFGLTRKDDARYRENR